MDTQNKVTNEEVKPLDADEIWEDRQRKISDTIAKYLREEVRLPTSTEMEKETGLSRRVINDHLDNFERHQLYRDSIELLRLLQGKVLMKLASMALKGDLGATKLYFKTVKKMGIKPNRQVSSLYPEYGEPGDAEQNGEAVDPKRQQWEDTHHKLVEGASKLMTENKQMPTQGELAKATGLARQEISEHLSNFGNQPGYRAKMEQFGSIAGELFNRLYTQAEEGDVKAANVFFYLVTKIYPEANSMAGMAGQPGFGFLMAV